MWKLSQEEKEQIIIRSQAKQQQLADFSGKSWSDLWETDLDNFLRALAMQVNFLFALKQQYLKKRLGTKGKRRS